MYYLISQFLIFKQLGKRRIEIKLEEYFRDNQAAPGRLRELVG